MAERDLVRRLASEIFRESPSGIEIEAARRAAEFLLRELLMRSRNDYWDHIRADVVIERFAGELGLNIGEDP